MRDDVPAALPLIAFIAGLLAATRLVSAAAAIVALSVVAAFLWHWSARASLAIAFAVLGIFLGVSRQSHKPVEPGRFVEIEAPIESDWSKRDHLHMLRSPRFAMNGIKVGAPIVIYARFEPPQIQREAVVRAEGFLRLGEKGRYALSVKSARLLSYRGSISILSPATWNRLAQQRLRRYVNTNPAEVAMIEALVLGRGERLTDDARQNFRRGGTYHLLVFSGLQIALAAAVIAFALRWAGAPRISDWSLIAFAVLAPPFIGPTASVSRSSIGIALYAMSRLMKRPTSFENLWCVAALARLVLAPADFADPAFQLTYAGAGALIFIGKPLAARARWIAYAVAAEVVITPLTLFHFHQFALGGSVMTIVLTPIIFVMLVAGAAFCATGWPLLLSIITLLNRLCWFLNDLAAPVSGFFAAPPQLALAGGLIAALTAVALLDGRRRAAVIAAALVIPTAAAVARHISRHHVAHPVVTFLDVGQGDAILLRSGSRNILVDAGGRSNDPRFGEAVLLPLLVDRGVRRIDLVVLSHAHPDHCGGLPAVIEQLHVRELWLSPRRLRGECAQITLEAMRERETPMRLIRDGAAAAIGDLHVEAFAAQRPFRRAAENNSSVVVRVETGGRSILLTGDIEREAEADLASRIRPVDILKVPHHGSRSSSTPSLLAAAAPRVAVISCGAKNWFGHPHASVLKSMRDKHIRTWRTDVSGSIDVEINGGVLCRPEFDTPR